MSTTLRDALAELVALQDLREKYSRGVPDNPRHPHWAEYQDDVRGIGSRYNAAWAAARAALAQRADEPVAWRFAKSFWSAYDSIPVDLRPHLTALYESAPAAPAYVPLSDEQIDEIGKDHPKRADRGMQ